METSQGSGTNIWMALMIHCSGCCKNVLTTSQGGGTTEEKICQSSLVLTTSLESVRNVLSTALGCGRMFVPLPWAVEECSFHCPGQCSEHS